MCQRYNFHRTEYYRIPEVRIVIEANVQNSGWRLLSGLFLVVLVFVLAACAGSESGRETVEPARETAALAEQMPTVEALAEVPATWTAVPQVIEDLPDPTDPAPATSTALPTSTETLATDTPEPTDTATPEPTATSAPTKPPAPVPTSPPVPAATAEPAVPPTLPPEPVLGVNLLPNGSFENGHYNQNGVPELQLPNGWRIEWDEGPTGFGNQSYDVYVRPEARVLSKAFLPPEEHSLYIYDGENTIKIFKGSGAVSFRLLTDVALEPGTYVIEAKMFADIVQAWENREKVWPADPTAAEFHFIVGDGGTFWTQQNYGKINVHNWTFTVDTPQTVKIGLAFRGKYAIANNGWFIDDVSLRRVE